MATRPRTPTFRTQPSVRRVYETLNPSSEMKETPEAFLLHVYLPGFTRDRIKITFVGSSRVVRITGERPIQGNRWSRLDKTYPVPENCVAEALQGKFDVGTLVLTMPKKSLSQLVNNTTPETRSSGPLDKVAAEENTEKSQETMIPPPQSNKTSSTKLEEQNGDKKRVSSLPSPMKGSSDLNAKMVTPLKDAISSSHQSQSQRRSPTEIQKQEDVRGSKNLNPPEDLKGHQEQTAKTTAAAVTVGKPQKGGQEDQEFEAKQNSTMTATIPKDDEKIPKREEEMKLKARLAEMRKQLEEKTDEKESISREVVKEQEGKSSESRKSAVVNNNNLGKGIFKEKEIRTRKVVSAKKAEASGTKVHQENNIVDSVGNGIRELASSASLVVTRITEGKLNDEEKYLVANMGAAVLVIAALGAYVSYKFAGA